MTRKTNAWDALIGQRTGTTRARGANLETALMGAIVRAMRAHGLWVERIPVQGVQHSKGGRVVMKRSPLAGFPDLLVIGPEGTTGWLEVKTAKGRATPLQLERIKRLESLGHVAAIVRSVDEALSVLKENAFIYCPIVDAKNRALVERANAAPEEFNV